MRLIQHLKQFARSEAGTTITEYAIIASLISVLIISVVAGIGTTMNERFQNVNEALGGR